MSRKGIPNQITKITREVFSQAFIELGGVDRLMRWAQGYETTCTEEAKPATSNMKHFYTLFAKVLPKEIKIEDTNRTHEQFIELINAENKQLELTKGEPTGLIEVSSETQRKEPNAT